MNQKEFLKLAKKKLKKHGYIARFIPKKYFNTATMNCVAGWFDRTNKSLTVATKCDSWFTVFVHEYCHFLQEIEKSPKIHAYYKRGGEEWFKWMKHWIEAPKYKVKKYQNCVMDLELDCEKRVVEIIKKHKLKVNIEEYIQSANSYIFQYEYETKRRKGIKSFVKGCSAIINPQMPKKFLPLSHYQSLPKEYEKLFKKYFK